MSTLDFRMPDGPAWEQLSAQSTLPATKAGSDTSVCVIVPTRNEAGNVVPLLARLGPALRDYDAQIVFVDDSDDQTPQTVVAAAATVPVPVRLLHRSMTERRGGLSGAVVAGIASTSATWVVVMDGDLQHPPELVPELLKAGVAAESDVVVASRYLAGGSNAGLGRATRSLGSLAANGLARAMFPRRLRLVTDPMSGFFAVRRGAVTVGELRPNGFKILLELLLRGAALSAVEVPFAFAARHAGESKASAQEARRYLAQVAGLRLSAGHRVGRSLRFAAVGASGVVVNLSALAAALLLGGAWGIGTGSVQRAVVETLATQVAIGWNFILCQRWVFVGGATSGRDFLRRFLPFWAMNNVALLLQLPLAESIAAGLNVPYFWATAAALAILIAVRFAMSDLVLWRSRRPERAERAPA